MNVMMKTIDIYDVTVEELMETVNDLVEAESPWLKLITPQKIIDDSFYTEPKLYEGNKICIISW